MALYRREMRKVDLFKPFMPESAGLAVLKTLYSGFIGQGPRVDEFEAELRRYLGWDFLTTVNSGTTAIHLALKLLNIGPDDEVISTPLTCTATNFPILHTGAKIVWADVDRNCNIDLEDVKHKITSKTKAIVVVHWGGFCVDLDRLAEIAGDIPVIEDCAHAFGAEYGGKKIGASGNFCCFSFQAIKSMTTVDGGLLTMPERYYERAKLLRWYGISREDKTRIAMRCLHPRTKIRKPGGYSQSIVEMYRQNYRGDVLAMKNGQLIQVKVKNIFKNPRAGRAYVQISTQESGPNHASIFTSDHLIATPLGWKEAGQLRNGDEIFIPYTKPSSKQVSILIGSCLGDGSIATRFSGETSRWATFAEGHSAKQREYCELKFQALQGLGAASYELPPNVKQKRPNGYFGFSLKSAPWANEWRKIFYPNGKKIIPREFLKEYFDDFSMAVWFMDDGSISIANTAARLRYNAQIATCCFEEDDVRWLCDFLKNRGFDCHPLYDKSGWRIFFTVDGSDELIKRIAKYVPASMRYKVGHNATVDNFDPTFWGTGESQMDVGHAIIGSVVGRSLDNYQSVYCLEVDDDAHNFATTAVIAHNCESDIAEAGFKWHMNDVNATIGLEQLKYVDETTSIVRENAVYYDEELVGLRGVISTPPQPKNQNPSYWLYTILVDHREDFISLLASMGIGANPVHVRNDIHSCLAAFRSNLPMLDEIQDKICAIPVHRMVSEEDRKHVVECIKLGWM